MLEDHKHKQPTHDFDGITENRVNTPPKYFTILFYGLILWGAIFIAYYLFSGWSSSAEFAEKMAAHDAAYNSGSSGAAAATVASNSDTEASVDAAALFANYCAGCHGADGKGGFGSDLTRSSYTYGKDQDAVRTSIAEGRGGGKMPGFGGQLSAAELDALADYTLNL